MKNKFTRVLVLLFALALSTGYGQIAQKVGEDPYAIETSAVFEVQSTTKGVLPPRLTTAQRDAIVSPVAGLSIYNLDKNCMEWYNGTLWYNGCGDNIAPAQVGGNAICDGSRSTTVVEVAGTGGRIWMDRNLGASRAATSFDDKEAYGCLYQWGRGNDGHASISWSSSSAGSVNGLAADEASNTTTTLSAGDSPGDALFISNGSNPFDWRSSKNDLLWQGVSGINNPCPAGFRLPTISELDDEFTGSGITSSKTGYESPLKLVVAGDRYYSSAALDGTGSNGYYWSADVNGTNVDVCDVYYSSTIKNSNVRSYGFSVRCIKD